jgi:hypothetical protein
MKQLAGLETRSRGHSIRAAMQIPEQQFTTEVERMKSRCRDCRKTAKQEQYHVRDMMKVMRHYA